MKMVKSLLLGTAAGFVAVAGAQAADLPVKARAVEYVKVCSIYGDGFFYIPGTDTCIKLGGYVNAFYMIHAGGSFSPLTIADTNTRFRNDVLFQQDYYFSGDIRSQTEYGTLRAYYRSGFRHRSDYYQTGTFLTARAFIQFAGFTFGKTASFFEFYAGAYSIPLLYVGGGATGGGTLLAAYTANLGNGIAATISLEDGFQRRQSLWDAGQDTMGIFASPTPLVTSGPSNASGGTSGIPLGDYAGNQMPDVVASLRVDQAWGSAQIAAAIHQVRGGLYGNNTLAAGAAPGVGPGQWTGVAPSDAWGWAVMGGLNINLPWTPGDKFWIEAGYTVGATAYLGPTLMSADTSAVFGRFNGNGVAFGYMPDGVFANTVGPAVAGLTGSGIQLTTGWTIGAAVEHYWTPALRTAVSGTYTGISYNSTARTIYCSSPVGPVRTAAGATPNFATGPVIGCNPDWNWWGVGIRTVWTPVRNLDLSLEVAYTRVEQNMSAATTTLFFAGAGGRPGGLYTPTNDGLWQGMFRVQRNF